MIRTADLRRQRIGACSPEKLRQELGAVTWEQLEAHWRGWDRAAAQFLRLQAGGLVVTVWDRRACTCPLQQGGRFDVYDGLQEEPWFLVDGLRVPPQQLELGL